MVLPALMIFASADAQATSTALWVAGGFAALGGIPGIMALLSQFATRRELETMEKRLAETRQDFQNFRNETRAGFQTLADEISDAERRLNSGSEERAEKTHNRINEILASLSTLAGRFDQSRH